MLNVGVCGFGYWGPNLFRNFAASRRFKLAAVAEKDDARRAKLAAANPGLDVFADALALIDSPAIDAVAIATPVGTHFPLARHAMERGKHVLIEKPMCATVAEAEELVQLAKRSGLTLMVDHTFLFSSAVRKIRELHEDGTLGKISYFDSLRVNLGLFQPDVNVLWDLAPHDFSIMDFILGDEPLCIEATGYCHVNPHLPDIVYVTMHLASGAIAHFNLSWMSPIKVRRIAIGGARQMVVWDDLNREEKIKIYNSGINVQPEHERMTIVPDYRIGDIYSPRLNPAEPLAGVVDHFANVIDGREVSILSGDHGLRVVRMLEQAQIALDQSLARIAAATRQPS